MRFENGNFENQNRLFGGRFWAKWLEDRGRYRVVHYVEYAFFFVIGFFGAGLVAGVRSSDGSTVGFATGGAAFDGTIQSSVAGVS